jgi:L-alanine-DL-glutamate epimerase-like enolase superfamily enzyme
VYAAGGYYYPGKGLRELQDEMRRYLDLGYTVVKLKIGGAPLDQDLARVEAVIDVVGEGSRVAVDANGRFDLETALAYAEALAPYGLFWLEEAGDPLDFELQAGLAAAYTHATATGENLFSLQDARNLIRYGGMRPERDYLQFDPSLCYGLVEYLRIVDMLRASGWSLRRCIPHGGHQFALHIAAGLHLGGNESYPGVFQPIGGFGDAMQVVDGRVRIPDEPGIGIEQKADLYAAYAELAA